MSIRTIIEINHDYLGDLTDSFGKIAVMDFLYSLRGATPDEPPPGIRVLAQRHHSDEITLEVK